MELRQKLTLDPEQVPEPTSHKSTSLRLIVLQMCAISGFAALVAWAVVSLLAPKQTGKETSHVTSPSQSIVGNSAKQVPAQSLMTVAPAERPAVAGAQGTFTGRRAHPLSRRMSRYSDRILFQPRTSRGARRKSRRRRGEYSATRGKHYARTGAGRSAARSRHRSSADGEPVATANARRIRPRTSICRVSGWQQVHAA